MTVPENVPCDIEIEVEKFCTSTSRIKFLDCEYSAAATRITDCYSNISFKTVKRRQSDHSDWRHFVNSNYKKLMS